MAVATSHETNGDLVEILKARCETNAAQRDAALDALLELVRYVRRIGGFMQHEDQCKLRTAEAVLAENGRAL